MNYRERSVVFWGALSGGVFIGLAVGASVTIAVLRLTGAIQ